MRFPLGLALALALAIPALACGRAEERAQAAAPGATADAEDRAAPDAEAAPVAARKRQERPLPAFSGWTLEGERLDVSSLLGKRLLIFFFNPEVKESAEIAQGVAAVAKHRGNHNFEVLGVATGSKRETVESFVRAQGLDFRVIDDSNAAIARRLGMRSPTALLGADAEGYILFGFGQFPEEGDLAVVVESLLRRQLRLPPIAVGAEPVLGDLPEAPSFTAPILGKEERFDLAAHRGRPVVLIFFLHTCPHCHETLAFLKEALAELPEDKRPVLAGVEITGRTYAVRSELEKRELDFFPVLFDDDQSIRNAYGVFAGVPETFLIDAEGRIRSRVSGWRSDRDPPLMRMRLAQLSGAPVPMLLRAKGYSGSEVCGVCHQVELETWQITTHATAYDTLVRHGAEGDDECVSCHVVGHGETGGYVSSLETPDLENVGCESCHGRGGPHLSPGFVSDGDYRSACVGCHDAKHSLGFEYAAFRPRISHAENAHLAALPLEEKRKLLAERGRPRQDLLPTGADFVGSDACRDCHAAEYATWSAGGHAGAVKTLAAAGKSGNPDCLKCHTTGYGRPGGFPEGAAPVQHADLARVGCESCHGPGGDHVKEGAQRIGSIVSLGDKCDSCVILQICGGCHDEANDPGFEFEVLDKIEKQRHGTIEPGTGKPKGASAWHAPPHPPDTVLLGRAFGLLGDGTHWTAR